MSMHMLVVISTLFFLGTCAYGVLQGLRILHQAKQDQ